MIPFASQRGGGQDLATHLMNAHDNEFIEIGHVRGAVAKDLHGAFAEWEAQAHALTKCRQYLCSLSISPDQLQGRITREQYFDYIERAEERMGLTGQPRAVIFHIKEDARGQMREHCHVVWSRIDVEQGKARPLSFFKDKLMTVTREFARDHGLELPDGYHRQEDKHRRNRQLSSYDAIKQKETGITHEERIAAVTSAWQRSDSAAAFVNALEDAGYVLACGRNKTRLVLVDIYGHVTALTRLIDDPTVRARQVREFLGPDYAAENLPTAEEAQELAGQRRKAIEEFEKARIEHVALLDLKRHQSARRAGLEAQAAQLETHHRQQRTELAYAQRATRQQIRTAYLHEKRHVKIARAQHRPQGLAAFLGRITGMALITKKLHAYRDRKRYEAYLRADETLKQHQQREQKMLARRQVLKAADVKRKIRALEKIEKRERESQLQARRKEHRQQANARHKHMPTFTQELKPRGRKAVPHKAMKRHTSELARELARVSKHPEKTTPVNLKETFERSARDKGDEDKGKGESGSGKATGIRHQQRRFETDVQPARDFSRAAEGRQGEGDGKSSGGDGGLKPDAQDKIARRRRQRARRRDAERSEHQSDNQQRIVPDKNAAPEQEKGKRRRKRNRRRPGDRDRDRDRGR